MVLLQWFKQIMTYQMLSKSKYLHLQQIKYKYDLDALSSL